MVKVRRLAALARDLDYAILEIEPVTDAPMSLDLADPATDTVFVPLEIDAPHGPMVATDGALRFHAFATAATSDGAPLCTERGACALLLSRTFTDEPQPRELAVGLAITAFVDDVRRRFPALAHIVGGLP